MSDTPTHAELERFIPQSLGGLPTPPVFLLRAGSRRDRDRYQMIVMTEGLQRHSVARVREESLNGLRALWDPASFEQHVGRVRSYWDAIDAFVKRKREGEEDGTLDFPAEDATEIEQLLSRVPDGWPPLRELGADNVMFASRTPSIMLSIMLAGWEGVDASHSREGGVVPLDLLEKLETRLDVIERQHLTTGTDTICAAYLKLCSAAGSRLFNVDSPATASEAA